MEQPHCVRLIKAEWTSASLGRTLRCRAPWSSPMPQIVLIRLKRKAFPEVISHLVPAYCATPADSYPPFFLPPQTLFPSLFSSCMLKNLYKNLDGLFCIFYLCCSVVLWCIDYLYLFNNHLFFSSFTDLLQWSPPLWRILSRHERLGTRLSQENGWFCIFPLLLSTIRFKLPLKDPSAVYGNYGGIHTLEDLSFSGATIFLIPTVEPKQQSFVGDTPRQWRTILTVGWRTPWWRPTMMRSLAARLKNCDRWWNWEARRR